MFLAKRYLALVLLSKPPPMTSPNTGVAVVVVTKLRRSAAVVGQAGEEEEDTTAIEITTTAVEVAGEDEIVILMAMTVTTIRMVEDVGSEVAAIGEDEAVDLGDDHRRSILLDDLPSRTVVLYCLSSCCLVITPANGPTRMSQKIL